MSELQNAALECKDVKYVGDGGREGSFGKDIQDNLSTIDRNVASMKTKEADFLTKWNVFSDHPDFNAFRTAYEKLAREHAGEMKQNAFEGCQAIANLSSEVARLKTPKDVASFTAENAPKHAQAEPKSKTEGGMIGVAMNAVRKHNEALRNAGNL